jgi:pimeloyl-ACP methyl ester carboxylesterase
MKLEVITKMPRGDHARSTPLLFIHGVFSCARIWEPFFLPFFAERGYPAYAVSVRGHGRSEGREGLATARLRDYLEDVEQVVDQIGRPPVLIGVSMGGVLVQHYLRRRPVAAAVLMASGPPHGMIPSSLSMAVSNPLLVRDMALMSMLGPGMATVDGARRALFRADTPDDYIRRYLPEAQPESPLVMLDVTAFDLPPSAKQRCDAPIMVLGAERDAFVSSGAVDQTARTFGVKPTMFPEMAHAMMLDPDWEKVARHISGWLERVLPRERNAPASAVAV